MIGNDQRINFKQRREHFEGELVEVQRDHWNGSRERERQLGMDDEESDLVVRNTYKR